MSKRKSITAELSSDLMREAGWRCAIPVCRVSNPLEHAHIDPVANDGENNFFNMIILCCNCHRRFHDKTEKYMTLQEMINIKKNLMVLNGRYSSFEVRVMENFLQNPDTDSVELFGRDFDVMYLIKDGFIVHDGRRLVNAINFPPKTYILTKEGKKFINRWKSALLIDE